MKKLLEKIKSMNRGLLIGICVGIVLVIALVVTLIVMAATKPADNGKDPADTTAKIEETTKKEDETTAEEETTAADDTTAEDTTALDTTALDTTVADTTVAHTTTPPVTQAQTTNPPETNSHGGEMTGAGSASEPYLEIPVVGNNSSSITTVSIPAGGSKFYSIQRIGGMVVTLNNANAYIICNGTRYDAQGGKISFIAPAALASEFITMEIGNKGGAACSFTLVFTNLVGSQANPSIISTMGSTNTISLAAGDSDGYNYKYKAERAGTIRFYISANVASILTVTNNRNSTQRTTDADAQTDASGTYVEMEVQAGDEIIIIVGAAPDRRNKFPAVTINWYGKYI